MHPGNHVIPAGLESSWTLLCITSLISARGNHRSISSLQSPSSVSHYVITAEINCDISASAIRDLICDWIMNSCINRCSLAARRRENRAVFSFVHCLYQFVVLAECKYHLYIFNKYNIDIDFFKQTLFVLSMMQMLLCFYPSKRIRKWKIKYVVH